jgi:excisionase family DNA binding protein
MKKLLDPDSLISQTEAAELRGVTRASINELVQRGRLRSVTIGGKVLLYRSEVEAFERSKGGRPPDTKAQTKAKAEASTIVDKPKRAAKKGGKK